jgi:hypothetical protein
MAQNQLPVECKAEVRRELEKVKKSEHTRSERKSVSEKKGDILSPYPTQLTRCNPFLPVRNTTEKEKLDLTLADGPWGSISYRGPALTTSHEDILVVVLALIFTDKKGHRVTDVTTGRDHYVYTGSKKEVLRARGEANPNTASYSALDNIIEDMSAAVIKYRAKDSTAKNIDNLASYVEDRNGNILIRINSYFVDAYEQRLVTWISLKERMRIETLTGRALHRFISSHQNGEWTGSLETLANAINLPRSLPLFKRRNKIRKAISEMVTAGILKDASAVFQKTKVKLVKVKPGKAKHTKP